MDIKIKFGNGNIINVNDLVFKIRRYGTDETVTIPLEEITKVEILDDDELIVFKDDEKIECGVFDKKHLKKLSHFYELINKEKYDLPKKNFYSVYAFLLHFLRLISVSLFFASLIRKNYIFTAVSICLIVISSLLISSLLAKDYRSSDPNRFDFWGDIFLTGNGALVYVVVGFILLVFFGIFLGIIK